MKKIKNNIWLILIVVVAFFLRFNYDIFINGYNFDEMAIVSTAVQDFPFGIIKLAATNDYHAPLYQLIIHFITYLDNEWIYLRLINIILSLINVVVFYKIGKLLKNETTGYFCSLILAVNHFQISMVSFVKFYCLAFLLFSFSTYYLIKIIKENKGHISFGICNSLFILTFTFGFFYIFLEFLFLYLFKKPDKKTIKSLVISLIGFIIYLPVLLFQTKLSFENIIGPHSGYVDFGIMAFINALNDYFSPFLNNCCNLITIEEFALLLKFFLSIQNKNTNWYYLISLIIFSYIPIGIASFLIIKGIIKNEIIKKINLINLSYLIFFIILTKLAITGFIPIYLFAFAIILFISSAVGLEEIKNKKIQIILIFLLLFPQIFIQNCYPPSKRDLDKAKIYYCYEVYFKEHKELFLQNKTKLIATAGGRFVKNYYRKYPIIEFDYEKMCGSFGKEYISLIFGEDFANKINKKNAKDMLIDFKKNKKLDKNFEKYFVKEIVNKTQKNEKIVLSFFNNNDSPFLFDDLSINNALKEDKIYNYKQAKADIKTAINNENNIIDTSSINAIIEETTYSYLINLLDKYFKKISIEQYEKTPNDNFIKTYESSNVEKPTLWYAKYCSSSWIFITYVKE